MINTSIKEYRGRQVAYERDIIQENTDISSSDRYRTRVSRVVSTDGTVFLLKGKLRHNNYSHQCYAKVFIFTKNNEWSELIDFPWESLESSNTSTPVSEGHSAYRKIELEARTANRKDLGLMMDKAIELVMASLPAYL